MQIMWIHSYQQNVYKVTWILRDSQNYFTVIRITDGSCPVDNHNRKIWEGLGPRADPRSVHKGANRKIEKN